MELVITIDLTSKAMEHHRYAELWLMYYHVTQGLERGETKGVLLDSKGHDCGDWEITESLAEMKPRK